MDDARQYFKDAATLRPSDIIVCVKEYVLPKPIFLKTSLSFHSPVIEKDLCVSDLFIYSSI